MKKNSGEIAQLLGVTPRRVRQLLDLGVLIADDDGRIDPDAAARRYGVFTRRDPEEVGRLVARLDWIAREALTAASRLSANSSLAAARRVAELARDFDETGALIEAVRPESERGLLANTRAVIVGRLYGQAIEVVQARQQRVAG